MNNEKQPIGVERIENRPSFTESLIKLSDIKNPTPLETSNLNIESLVKELVNSGINLEAIKKSPELMASISESQFRDFDSGRGPAMVVAFGGKENLQKYFNWTINESSEQQKLTNGDDESRSRGLRQFAADTVSLALGELTSEEYCRKTNWRVGKKFQKDETLSQSFKLPTDEKGQKKLKQTSSIPKGSAIKAFDFLTSFNKK